MVRVRAEALVLWGGGDSGSWMLEFGRISVGSVVGIFEKVGVGFCYGFQGDCGVN